MSRPHPDRARASAGRTFPFSPAFLPLVDAGERQAPVDHALIGGSTLVAGFTLLSRFAPVRDLFICAEDLLFAANRISDRLPAHATLQFERGLRPDGDDRNWHIALIARASKKFVGGADMRLRANASRPRSWKAVRGLLDPTGQRP